jgi:trans-aconitate 2-methyltransferase
MIEQYKWDALDYATSSSAQQQWARELIGKLQLKGDESLLDIGCGDGKVTAEIAASLPSGSVLGVDSSAEMIALAQSQYPADAFPNLRFQKEDARSLPFSDEFTVVFSNATLHWVLDHAPVLDEIHKSLRRGGKVLLQMGGRGNAADVVAVLDKLPQALEWRDYFEGFSFPYGFYGPDEYQEWLRKAGLQARRVELIPKDMIHQGQEGLAGWIRTTWLPYTQRVPEERREAFVAQLVDKYLERHPVDEQGLVHVRMVRLEVEALKL